MNTTYREIPKIRYQLSMYGWTVEELDDYLVIDMKGDVFYVPYPHINDVGADSIVRYCKARFTISKKQS